MSASNFIPIIIDIEASGLYGDSYPIEVGLSLSDTSRFCTLIKPLQSWTHWDPDAEEIHEISLECLHDHGKPVTEVALYLNELLENKTVYTDGWVVDNPWIIKLFYAAGVQQKFRVSDLQMILKEKQMEIWHEVKNQVMQELKLQRHRASSDARIIQETYLRTLKL